MRHIFLTLGFTTAMMISSSKAVQGDIQVDIPEGAGLQMVQPGTYWNDANSNPLRDSGINYDSAFSAKAYLNDVNGNAAIQRRSFLLRRKQGHVVHQRRSEKNEDEEDEKENGDEVEEEDEDNEESDDF